MGKSKILYICAYRLLTKKKLKANIVNVWIFKVNYV
jgi:hypothetical protein